LKNAKLMFPKNSIQNFNTKKEPLPNSPPLHRLIPAHEDGRIGETLGLPARSRFGEGRAEPLNVNDIGKTCLVTLID
jgi:hypothetical protein